jgi:hypothetical protein
MFNRKNCIVAAVFGVPLIVFAQAARTVPEAADAGAAVAALKYGSVFAGALPSGEPAQTPDKNWIQANRVVAGDAPAPSDAGVPAPAKHAAGAHAHKKAR